SRGVVRDISSSSKNRVEKLAIRLQMVSLSSLKAVSRIVAKASTADATEQPPSGIESRMRRNRWTPQSVLRTSPPTLPKLDIMESLAKALVHLPFCSVSMINRFSGVAAAAEMKEKTE